MIASALPNRNGFAGFAGLQKSGGGRVRRLGAQVVGDMLSLQGAAVGASGYNGRSAVRDRRYKDVIESCERCQNRV